MGKRTDWTVRVFAGHSVSDVARESPAIVTERNRSAALEEAVQWLARLGSGLSAPQIDALRAWLTADPFHRQVLYEMAEIYDDLHAVTACSKPAFGPVGEARRFVPTLVE